MKGSDLVKATGGKVAPCGHLAWAGKKCAVKTCKSYAGGKS